jgi:hypothetical protein
VYTATAEKGIADAKARGAGNGVPGAGFVPPVTPGTAQPPTQPATPGVNNNPRNLDVYSQTALQGLEDAKARGFDPSQHRGKP